MPTDLRRRMDEHSENFSKELENIKKNQSELKNTITENKNSQERINSRLDDTEEQISDWSGQQSRGHHPSEQEKKKRIKKYEGHLRDLWDNIKHTKVLIIGVPEGKEGGKEA